MKILYISHLHPPLDRPLENVGGMQNVSIQLVDALEQREDAEIKTILLRAPWENIGVMTTLFLLKLLWRIPKAVREFKPDVILFSSMVTAGVLPFLSKKVTVPAVTINHGQDVTLPVWIYQKYLPYIFNRLSGVISVSQATRKACIERGMDPSIGGVLPNGYVSRKALALPEKKVAKQKLSEKFDIKFTGTPLLLTVGRQVKRKGHSWFIHKVMPLLNTHVNYLVIGDGPEFENIKKKVEESPFKNNICLTGRQPDEVLRYAYAGADLFIMPNIPVKGDMEGFGIVLLEANQAGVPAVASDLEGIRDVIEQGVNGYRVPHGQPEQFAAAIDSILNQNLEQLSASSRKYVEDKYNWETVVAHYLKFLDEVVKGKKGAETRVSF
ncbi:MAG: glycosyltransferase family 4 protein [Balneolaceae bacterium]